jgi:hypothetical protein
MSRSAPTTTSGRLLKPIIYGALAGAILLAVYFTILSLISGWDLTKAEFLRFRFFIVTLSIGFGIQVGLYVHLRDLVLGHRGTGKVLGVTGGTSTAAMISCCTHYLANLLPVLGATGVATLVGQYQIQLFWVGLLFNFGGIIFMASKVIRLKNKVRPLPA